MLRLIYFLSFLFSLFFLSSCEPFSKDKATVSFTPLRINCGGEDEKDSKTGFVWISDKDYLKKGKKHQFETKPFTQGVKEPAPKDVYQTARRSAITYRFKHVPDGVYTLRLHFMDGKKHARRKMEFRVNDRRIMQNFNIKESADGEIRAVVFECVIEVKDGSGINLKGTKGQGDDVLLSGIEILQAPLGTEVTKFIDSEVKRPDELAANLRSFAGGAVKLVWTRTDDEDDYYQKDNTGVLCGFDSEDGRGERVILPEQRSYALPMITPDGGKIIFTDQQQGKCFEVGFDGKGLRELVKGFASDVWRDPGSGKTWLYVRSSWNEDGATMGRYDLNDLTVREEVWRQSATGIEEASWFTISGDGRMAADGFPWPKCGLVDLEADDLKIMGNGCWPSVSPDDSHKYFYFLGKHTSIDFFDSPEAKPRKVILSTIPGWTDRKVYHPRWTNHVRYITATAPQWMPDTELYLGKFDEGFEKIESWFRITYNQKADYFGDAWFANGSQPHKASVRAGARPPVTVAANMPPGLVFIWENERARNVTTDEHGKTRQVWSVRFDGETHLNRWLGADIKNGGLLPSHEAAFIIAKAVRATKALSLAVDLPKLFPENSGKASDIAYLGDKQGNVALRLEQEGNQLFAGIKAASGKLIKTSLGTVDPDQPAQLIATYADGNLTAYRNGLEVSSVAVEANLADWNANTLIYGRDPQKLRSWRGSLENIRIFDRAIRAEEAASFYQSSAGHWSTRAPAPKIIVEAELIQSSEAADPERIAPYTRSLAENLYRVKSVVSGQLEQKEIIVLQWVILGGRVLPSADREEGKVYRLTLEPLDAHVELSGEHRSTDLLDTTSSVFYEVDD